MPRASSPRCRVVRYAVVGMGFITQSAVLPAFAHARRNSRLHAIVSGDKRKLDKLGGKYRVPVRGTYEEYEECLEGVDAVYICTPNSSHAEHAIRAARVGVHVLCEKPLAVTVADCERIIRACRTAGVKLMTAYRLHFEPLYLEIIDRVRRGDIGEPRYFTSSFSMHARPGGIRTRRATGGGTLFDLGVYCINAARVLFQANPRQVVAFAASGRRAGMPEIDEMSSAVLRFDKDRLATFTTSFAAGGVSEFRVVGTKGDIRADPAYELTDALAYARTRGERTRAKRGRKRDQFAPELLYFSDCILKNRAPEPSGDEGARDVRIVTALYESARRARPITLRALGAGSAPDLRQAASRPPVREPKLVHITRPHD